MILLRSEPCGKALWAILEIARLKGLSAGFRIDGVLTEEWRERIVESGQVYRAREYANTIAMDPQVVGFMPLNASTEQLIADMFDSRLFGYDKGLRPQDLFLSGGLTEKPFLATISSEMDGSVDLTRVMWQRYSETYPELSQLALSATGVRFLNEPYSSDLLSDLAEAASSERSGLLKDALDADRIEYGAQERALAAAELVIGVLQPLSIGDIAWKLTDSRPPSPQEVIDLLPKAIEALRAIAVAPEWRGHWSRYHALPGARAEVEWLLAVADEALTSADRATSGPVIP